MLFQRIKDLWYFFKGFFPLRLLFLHFRRSYILIIFWLLIFSFLLGKLGGDYGLQYLFLAPEYLGKVSFFSYFIVGLSMGLFIMSFHISSYIYYSYRYTFLATLDRPLWKFSLNNSIIPAVFFLVYLFYSFDFQLEEGISIGLILINLLGLFLGAFVMISISLTYFLSTINQKKTEQGKSMGSIMKKDNKLIDEEMHPSGVNHYLSGLFSTKLARKATHYSKDSVLETFQQHHGSASLFFTLLFILILVLAAVGGSSFFIIPAAASIFLIFSLYLMITGAVYTRLKTWTLSVGIVVIFLLNHFSGKEFFKTWYYAPGMDYSVLKEYSQKEIETINTDSILLNDKKQAELILDKWLRKQKTKNGKKPKLIVLNLSGGGLRSGVWALKVLSELEKEIGEDFSQSLQFISGSSGGMLGAAYYRQLRYAASSDSIEWEQSISNLSQDLLNPIAFNLAVNDLFFRFRDYTFAQKDYSIDRGIAFDQQLNVNTKGVLNKRLFEFSSLEESSEIPLMVLSPSIIGDGRKLIISPTPLSFLCSSQPYSGVSTQRTIDAIEFSRYFQEQSADSLSFLTALRMSASFPYITPLVNLPSEPSMELIDAGVRDNEGFELGLKYILAMESWLKENTSGVVIVQLMASRKEALEIKDFENKMSDRIIKPISGVIESFSNLQIYNKAFLMELSDELEGLEIDLVRFNLLETQGALSLSWHLTQREKNQINKAWEGNRNQSEKKRLQELLN